MRILILALSGIGDALMFTPASKKIKDYYPDSRIDVLVMFKGVKDLYESLPEVNQVFYFDFINAAPIKSFKYILSFRKKYDLTFNVYPANRIEYNVIQWLIAAPKRTGINYLHQNLRNFNFLSNIRIDESNDLHNVETNIKLVDRVTRKTTDSIPELRFPIPEKNQQNAQQILNGFGIKESDKVIGFHPGGSIPKNHINKRWSPEKYAELAKYLIEKKSFKVCVFGGPDESDLKSEIIKRTGSEYCYAIDTKSLVDTAAVMRRCDLFVSNDSSLMHVAAALQLKTVAIEGPLNINFTRPWKTEHKIVSLNLECSPCFYYSPKHLTCYRDDVKFKCMKEISVEMVKNKFDEINS